MECIEFNWLCKHSEGSQAANILFSQILVLNSVWVSLRGAVLTQIVTLSGHWLVWGFFKSIKKPHVETIFSFIYGTSLLNECRMYMLNKFFISKFFISSSEFNPILRLMLAFYLKQYVMKKWKQANFDSSLYLLVVYFIKCLVLCNSLS